MWINGMWIKVRLQIRFAVFMLWSLADQAAAERWEGFLGCPDQPIPCSFHPTCLRMPHTWFGRTQSSAGKLDTTTTSWESGTTAQRHTCPGSSDLSASLPSTVRSSDTPTFAFISSAKVWHCFPIRFWGFGIFFLALLPFPIARDTNSRTGCPQTHTTLRPSKQVQINWCTG